MKCEIQARIHFTRQERSDILEAAVKGSSFWAQEVRTSRVNYAAYDLEPDSITSGIFVEKEDDDGNGGRQWRFSVTSSTLDHTASVLLTNHLNALHLTQAGMELAEAMRSKGPVHLTALAANQVVQQGMFGEIFYREKP